MKVSVYFFIFFICFYVTGKSQNTYSPSTGNTTVTLPCGQTHTFVDAGGATVNYPGNLNYTVTFVPSTPGQCIKLSFSTFSVHTSETFSIFDGPNASSNLIGTFNGQGLNTAGAPLTIITSTSGALTFVFSSNNSNNTEGWTSTIECVTCLGPQISMNSGSQTLTCGNIYQFFDSGGPSGNYSNNENITQTFYPSTQGSCMSIVFQGINTANNDILSIYNGSSTASPLIGSYVNQSLPPAFNTNGPVTFQWVSNGTNNRVGWYALIQCTPCPAPTTQTITCGTPLTFTDSGGSGGNYGNNENYTVTLVPSNPSQCIAYTFSSFNTNSSNDFISLYNGGTTAAPLIGTYFNTNTPPSFTTSGGALTYVFQSDGSGVSSGWVATASCVTCPVTLNTFLINPTGTVNLSCPSNNLFFDSGGAGGNYANSENFTKTFSVAAGNCLSVAFSPAFALENSFDRLRVFDGPNGASPLIGNYTGNTGPGTIQSSGTSLTFSFTSDGSVTQAGWQATVSCIAACSGTPNGGTATSLTPPCPTSGSVGLTVTGASSACGLTYQWQSSSSSSGPWTNVAGATGQTISVPTSSTTYYRRLTNCGVNSGASLPTLGTLASVTCTPGYVASSITYSFTTFTGNLTPTTDDVLYNNIAMFGFPVCYNGAQFWGGYIASNSAFVFDAIPCYPNILTNTYAGPGVGTGWSISQPAPNTSEPPRNAVLAPWHDTYPPAGGIIQYTTVGTAPNRVFIASWQNIPLFSCTTLTNTSQVKIFETTNIIEIHVGQKQTCTTFNDGQAILGLHNFDGTVYTPPVNATAHNAALSPATNHWAMTTTAYRFTPNACAGGGSGCLVLPIKLSKFYGERRERINHLFWETSSESEVKNYVIERSTDAINFTAIGSKAPANRASLYEFQDHEAKQGITNYYRIAIENSNGTIDRTYIYPLGGVSDDLLNVVSVYPNPGKAEFNIAIDSKADGYVILKLSNIMGNQVKSEKHDVSKGFNHLNLNTINLPDGIYILSVENSMNEVISKIKLIKN